MVRSEGGVVTGEAIRVFWETFAKMAHEDQWYRRAYL